MKKLIKLEVRFDYPDIKGRTPFLNFYEQQLLPTAYEIVEYGANVN